MMPAAIVRINETAWFIMSNIVLPPVLGYIAANICRSRSAKNGWAVVMDHFMYLASPRLHGKNGKYLAAIHFDIHSIL